MKLHAPSTPDAVHGRAGTWLKDRFCPSWQVAPRVLPKLMSDPDRDKANGVTAAMMKMKKLDVAELDAAAAG